MSWCHPITEQCESFYFQYEDMVCASCDRQLFIYNNCIAITMSLIRNYVTTQKWRKVWGPFVQRAIGKKPKADRRTTREVRKCVPLHSKIVNSLTRVFSCFLHVEHLETLSLPYKVSHLAPTLFAIFALFLHCDVIVDKARRK